MNTLATNKANNIQLNQINNINQINNTQQVNDTQPSDKIAFVETPKWLADLKCINPLNNKKGDNKSFEYAVALSNHKNIGNNSNRIKNVTLFLKEFIFDNINHSLEEKDKTFERNNDSFKSIVLKLGSEKEELHYHYNQKYTNNRNSKLVLILFGNNHYIYVKKPKLIQKFIKNN